MPNFDAGHYFLTVLAPIRLDSVLEGGQNHSRRHKLREKLAAMPTGERTAASQHENREKSPFERNKRTHFARFVVLDDAVFNGRMPTDSLLSLIRGINVLVPQKIDRLSTPFLIFTADFDAESGSEVELRAYLTELWNDMPKDLREIFENCVGFGSTSSAAGFCDYILKCQVETTMPFNDYWSVVPKLTNVDLIPYGIGGLIGLAALVIGLFTGPSWLPLVGLLVVGIAIFLAYRLIMTAGQRPFPTSAAPAPDSKLPTVLKSLYLQRAFTKFAIEGQGQDDEALYAEFGRFLAEHKPLDNTSPTQPPGVIGVKAE